MRKRCPEGRIRVWRHGATIILLCLATLPGFSQALPNDREQPIHITADKAVRDEKQGFTVYSGDVRMSQGSMHIEADKLTIYHINEDADKIVAEGRPAKMRQRPDLEKGPVYARAHIIEYYKIEQRVHLNTNAHIEQDGGTVAGDSIDYFIAQELVKAASDQAREGNRVQVVIPPSTQQSMGLAPTPPPAGSNAGSTPVQAPTDQPEPAADAVTPQQQEDSSGTTESE